MADQFKRRVGQRGLAVILAVETLIPVGFFATWGGFAAAASKPSPSTLAVAFTLAAVVLGGGWLFAWAVARGHALRAGRAAAITIIVLIAVALGIAAWVALVLIGGISSIGGPESGGWGPGAALLWLLPGGLVLLLGGLWFARWVGTGYWGREPRIRQEPLPSVGLLAWRVAERGADLKEYPLHDEPMRRLEAGTTLREVRRLGDYMRVRTPDGLEGWVAADRLEPAPSTGKEAGDG